MARAALSLLLLACTLAAPAALRGQDGLDREEPGLRRQADAIRASADRLGAYRRIPWVTDVFEGFRLAKAENRPVFLYTVVGDPLEDC